MKPHIIKWATFDVWVCGPRHRGGVIVEGSGVTPSAAYSSWKSGRFDSGSLAEKGRSGFDSRAPKGERQVGAWGQTFADGVRSGWDSFWSPLKGGR